MLAGLVPVLVSMSGCALVQRGGDQSILSVSEVRPGVFVHTGALEDWASGNGGDVSNSSFIVGDHCVAVIDTGGTPAVGKALRNTVANTTSLPVCYVINTHAHPDHMLGNSAFVDTVLPLPRFVASARFAATLSAREPYYLKALQREFGIHLAHAQIIYPSLLVERTLDLDLGGRIVTLQAWFTAHTDNDLTVLDRRSGTLIAADLLFAQHLPVVDGNLRGWLCAMAELKMLDVTTVVPGHGAVSHDWPAAMNAQTEYLNSLLRDTRSAIRGGLGIQQAIDRIVLPKDSAWLLGEHFQRRNVTAAFAELEWEDEAPETPDTPRQTPSCAAQQDLT